MPPPMCSSNPVRARRGPQRRKYVLFKVLLRSSPGMHYDLMPSWVGCHCVCAAPQVLPALSLALSRHVADPQHTDATRRFFLFLLQQHRLGHHQQHHRSSTTGTAVVVGPPRALDVNLKTPDALTVSKTSVLVQCLDRMKLDLDLVNAVMEAGHDLRPCVRAYVPKFLHARCRCRSSSAKQHNTAQRKHAQRPATAGLINVA